MWAAALLLASSLVASLPAPIAAVRLPADPTTATPPGAPAGNLVDNGGFETPQVVASWATYSLATQGLTDWTIEAGEVDVVTAPHWAAPEGDQVLDIDGDSGTNSAGSISQDIPTTSGTGYVVGFQYSGNMDCVPTADVSMDVLWGGVLVGTVTHDTIENQIEDEHSLASFDYQSFSTDVTGAAEAERTTLELRSNSPANGTCGIVVDDVYVVHANPPVWQASGPGAVTVIEDGSGGPPEFTYDFDPTGAATTGSGATGEWAFFTTATTAGEIGLDYALTGHHSYFGVTVSLAAFVIGADSGDTETELVSAGPANCDHPACVGDTPSAGFAYSGSTTVTVEPGDTYGFVITGSNGDLNDFLQGRLVVNGGVTLPADCAAVKAANPDAADGTYTIQPEGSPAFAVHCHDLSGTPKEYLPLIETGGGKNTGSYAAGGAAAGTTVTTFFTGLRLDPATLRVDIGDLTFATSAGSLVHPDAELGNPTVTSMPYATAMACNSGIQNGVANIDLTGTPFAVEDAFTPIGTSSGSFGGAAFTAADQVVDIEGNGNCGWRTPYPEGPFFVFDPEPGQFGLQLGFALDALSTPTLIRAVSTGGDDAFLIGRIDGASDIDLTLQASTAESCTAGNLSSDAAPVSGGPVSVHTDVAGYFGVAIDGVDPGDAVAVRVTSPGSTALSGCLVSSGDNDFWPKALELSGTSLQASDVIDSSGKARWYKFTVTPGQLITVNLTGLPADYDLAVFKDIGAEFQDQLVPQDAADLTELAAEYAPSVFSPSVFSPSVFSPSVFSPDAYAPSVFSPSVFSPSVFSPSVFSPSVFSPSVFSPSVFSPSVFSPSVFSPSVFSPSVFSPSVFSPSVFSDTELAQAFSSAQTRSIIGVSATPGSGDETVVVNSWNNTGSFYVRVAGHGGVFDPNDQFGLEIVKGITSCGSVTDTTVSSRADQPNTGVRTVILTDSSELSLTTASLGSKLATLAARAEVEGIVIDLATDARVQELKDQAEANAACPYAMNLVAEEIKGIVDSYRANNDGLRFVVVVGGDDVVPFFRYPDQSLLGQESGYFPPVDSTTPSDAALRRDFVLSQDAYGSGTEVSLRTSDFPIPGLAVGRLIETPVEIVGQIDAYIAAGGVVAPSSSLVTGYDFLEDAADAVKEELRQGTGQAPDTLITPNGKSPQDPASWTATQLGTSLLGSRHDVVFLAGHFSANSALAADFRTSLLTTDLAASPVNLVNSIVFSAGCHSGYNLLDTAAVAGVSQPLDWAQAFAQKRAILVAGTGYQYGDTDFLEYSERLYRDFARELRAGPSGSAVAVGEALMNAKRTYLATTTDIRGIHEKALLEATLFGLPMMGVTMPSGRGETLAVGSPITPTLVDGGPAQDLGLHTAPLSVTPTLSSKSLTMLNAPYDGTTGTTTASWLEGPDGVVSNPAEPALPLVAVNATSTDEDLVLRGVGFRGGSYTDTSPVVPLSGAPTTELRGVHAPFVSPVFYPMKLWTPNYYGQLGGSGGTNLLITPAQHKSFDSAAGTSIQRRYTGLDLRLFYSGNISSAALSDAPTIVSVRATPDGSDIDFEVQVVGDPLAAIHTVWITHTGGPNGSGVGAWASLDLTQSTTDSSLWTGSLPGVTGALQFVVQAANGLGLVSFDDNRGAYYGVTGTAAPTATDLTIVSAPTTGAFGGSASVTAQLTAGTTGVSGKPIFVSIGGGAGTAGVTGSDGKVTVSVPLSAIPGATQVVATFAGDTTHLGAGASAPITIAKAPSALSTLPAFATRTATLTPMVSRLTAQLDGKTQSLGLQTVTVTATGPVTRTMSVITDYLGRVPLPVDLPAGTYALTIDFAGDATYLATSQTGTVVVAPFTGFFSPVNDLPALNTAKAGSSIPLKFALGGDRGLALFALGYPKATPISCTAAGSPDAIEEVVASGSGLSYDPVTGQYKYVWKTTKSMKGCYRMELQFVDGSVFTANFQFK